MTRMIRDAIPAIVLLGAAVVLWLSHGTLAMTGADGGRIAVLPLSILSLAVTAAGVAALAFARRRGASLAPLFLLLLLVLPWLPGRAHPILLLWSGGLALLVWGAVAAITAASMPWPRWPLLRPQLAAGLLAGAIYAVSAWQVSPSIPGGDEPHYLVITQSLLLDRDLKIENNHRRGDYRAYFAGDLPPDFRQRGRDGQIYSVHMPGVSALVAPAFLIGGYKGVVLFLIALASAGAALAWHLAWRVTGRRDAAWFGWAAVTLSTTSIFHSFTIYPDGPGAVAVLTGIWALLRSDDERVSGSERATAWFWHGAALATLPWMHQRFAAVAGCLGALVLLRLARVPNAAGKAVAFLAAPAVSALGWIAYFIAIYGTADPTAPFGNEVRALAFIPGALTALLFDQRFGLLAYAPVLAFAFGGLGLMLARRDRRRLALEILFTAVPYLLVVTDVAMWWGGRSAPARFFTPVLLSMAIPAAYAWTRLRSRTARATALGALAFTGFASAVLVFAEGGRLGYNARESYAYWLEWLNGDIDLGRGLPAWWRDNEVLLFESVAVWAVALGGAWAALRAVERRGWLRPRAWFATAAAGGYAVAALAAVAITWSLSGVDGHLTLPAQLQVLRRLASEPRLLVVNVDHPSRVPRDRAASLLRLDPPPATEPGGAGRNDRPLFSIPAIPGGRYRLVPRGSGGGWLMLGIGRDQFSLRSETLQSPPQDAVLDFPVDVRAIVVRGDEQARRGVAGLTIEPLWLVPPRARLTADYARHAVRYGGSTVYFLDDHTYPEPEAFWVAGARSATVVVQPEGAPAIVSVLVRNAPVANRVLIESGGWRDEADLGPGEEHRVDVPLDTARHATLVRITTTAGFRPSSTEAGSRDDRFLGVWVKVGGN
jgi:hypothetical protein